MTVVNFNYPKFKYTIPSTGQPGVGYKLFTYEEGTSTKKTTWTSFAKTAENTNPIILDANGEANVWGSGNYKFVLALPTDTDPPTSPVMTVDALRSDLDSDVMTSVSLTPANGSFESDSDSDGTPDNWTISELTGGTVAIDATTSTHGVNSLKFTSTGSGAGTATTSEYYEAEGGAALNIYFSIISADATTLNKVEVYWYDANKTYLSSSAAYNNGTSNPTTWTRKYTSVLAPTTARYAKIVLTGVDAASTTHSSTNFGNVSISFTAGGFINVSTITPAGDSDVTLSGPEIASSRLVLADGAWTSGHNIIVPNENRVYFVDNIAGTYNAVIKTSAGSGITVLAGDSRVVVCDGTNVVNPLATYYTSVEVDALITATQQGGTIVSGAVTATTSGTSVDITGIPSWVKRVVLLMDGVSTNGTNYKLIQIGDSGGIETTGYLGAGSVLTATVNETTGFVIPTTVASNVHHGAFTLTLFDASTNTWVMSGVGALSDSQYMLLTSGSKPLSGTLDRIRLTTSGGTDTFDAGSITIIYE